MPRSRITDPVTAPVGRIILLRLNPAPPGKPCHHAASPICSPILRRCLPPRDLEIASRDRTPLGKAQQTFNRLLTQVDKLRHHRDNAQLLTCRPLNKSALRFASLACHPDTEYG